MVDDEDRHGLQFILLVVSPDRPESPIFLLLIVEVNDRTTLRLVMKAKVLDLENCLLVEDKMARPNAMENKDGRMRVKISLGILLSCCSSKLLLLED